VDKATLEFFIRDGLAARAHQTGIVAGERAEIIVEGVLRRVWPEVERLTERLAQFRAVCQKQSPFDADSCVRCSQYDLCLAEYEEAFSRL